MRTAAAAAARIPTRAASPSVARKWLAKLIPDLARHRRRGLNAVSTPGATASLWTHTFEELSLRDGPDWELPATLLQPPGDVGRVLVFFDERGRWTSLHRWGWLTRASGLFLQETQPFAVLSVDLPGWGDTRPVPTPFDVVSWGGIDRWTAYVSAATGESVMALRLREAVRVLDYARRRWRKSPSDLVVGGHGLGATIAGLAACLHGGLGGVLLLEPLAAFASLAIDARPAWPHDAYFPGILGAVDLPEALELQPAPALVIGPLNARQRPLGSRAGGVFRGSHVRVVPDRFDTKREAEVLRWMHALP
jgi:pimeloyl-ACP methyl ester carboxylesterase